MTTKRFIVIVLDSFGVGAMADDKKVRPQDVQACTCGHILEKLHVRLPNLEALGLMNALGHATPEMQLNPKAVFGRAALAHFVAEGDGLAGVDVAHCSSSSGGMASSRAVFSV